MAVIDGVQELVDLIDTEWNIVNTSNVKPTIDKITNVPFENQMGDSKGFVLLYSLNENEDIPGMGLQTKADVKELIKIDIRYGGISAKTISVQETRFNEYKAELKRILYSNRTNPTTNYCILDIDNKLINNLSNKTKKIFREVREVSLEANNRDMTI